MRRYFSSFGLGGGCIKKARGVKVSRNMHIFDCYSLFGGSARTGERLGETML